MAVITRETIQERRAKILAERDGALQHLAACNQAVAECEFWLKQIETPDPTPAEPPTPPVEPPAEPQVPAPSEEPPKEG